MSTLDRGVDVLETIGAAGDHRNVGLSFFVKPPCGSFDHCIGVRAQLRSGKIRSSPMPSSSP